jgi:hypothetical protein
MLVLLEWVMQQARPVAFLSKALGPVHQHLSIYDKEFLALIMAIEKMETLLTETRVHNQNRPPKLVLFV